MKKLINKISCFFFLVCLSMPSVSFAQISGATKFNKPVFCDDLAAFCSISVEDDLKSGNPDVIHNCFAKLQGLYASNDEDNMKLAHKIMHACFENYALDVFMYAAMFVQNSGGNFETDVDDIVGADRTTSRDEMAVTNKLTQKISQSIGSLNYAIGSKAVMDGFHSYWEIIQSNQTISSKIVVEGEGS